MRRPTEKVAAGDMNQAQGPRGPRYVQAFSNRSTEDGTYAHTETGVRRPSHSSPQPPKKTHRRYHHLPGQVPGVGHPVVGGQSGPAGAALRRVRPRVRSRRLQRGVPRLCASAEHRQGRRRRARGSRRAGGRTLPVRGGHGAHGRGGADQRRHIAVAGHHRTRDVAGAFHHTGQTNEA